MTDSTSPFVLATILARRWKLMACVFVAVIAAVAAITMFLPRKYEAQMKILVKNERADLVVGPAAGDSAYRGEVSEARINSEIELLTSRDLLRKVVVACDLYRSESSGVYAAGDAPPAAVERAMLRLQRDLTVTPVRKANVIQVEYVSTDPRRAASVLRQLQDLYLDAHLKIHATPGSYDFFKSQAARYASELRGAETRLAEFRQRENAVVLDQQETVTLQRAGEAEAALHQADASIQDLSRRAAELRQRLAALDPRIVTQARSLPNQYSVERLHTLLTELQNRRSQLAMKYRPDDPLVVEIDQEIANTRAGLDRAEKITATEQATDVNPLRQTVEADLTRTETELAGMKGRRPALAAQVAGYRARLVRLAGATTEYDALVRQTKQSEDNYLLYSKKEEEARIAQSLDQQKIANVAVAEAPEEPHIPSKPNVPLNLALGFCLACCVAVGSAVGSEYFSGTVDTGAEVEAMTGLPVYQSGRQ